MLHKVSQLKCLLAISVLFPLMVITPSCTEEERTPIAVESVEISTEYLALKEGETAELYAIVHPSNAENQKVSWHSDDDAIAEVNRNGHVIAVKTGITTIYVETDDGGYRSECTVKVLPNVILVEKVELSESSLSLSVGDEYQLTVEVYPSNATNANLLWTSSNTSVVIVDQGKLKAINTGSAKITVTTEDGKVSATCSVSVQEKKCWGLCGTFNDWGESGNDIPMSDQVSSNYYVASGVNLKNYEVDTFVFRYDNSWNLHRGANEEDDLFYINEKYSTAVYDDGVCPIFVLENGVYDIYLAKTLDYFYIMSKGQKPDDAGPSKISVTGVTLNKTSVSLNEGESYTLTYSIRPSNATDKSVTWQSSNSNVVTVTNAKITAVKEGTAVITVRTNDGGYTAKCNVVVNSTSLVDDITLSSSSTNNISCEANDYVISFSSANDWNAATDCDWITISPKFGTAGNNSISVQISKNTSKVKRTGNVTISSGTASAKISYIQEGAANTGGDGGNVNPDDNNKISLKVDLSSAFNYNWSDAEWEDYVNKYTNVDMSGYGADFDRFEYSDGWLSICFKGNVTTIPRVLPYASYAKTVVLPNSITHIGNYAFDGNRTCTTINIPESLQVIGEQAFAHATCIKELNLPQGIVSIGESAFYECPNLISATLPSSLQIISHSAFRNCTSLKNVKLGNNKSTSTMEIGSWVFCGCSSLSNITICSEVGIIGEGAFNFCKSLPSIKIPGTVAIVNTEAFSECTGLQYLEIGDNISSRQTIVKSAAFKNCPSLVKTTLYKSVVCDDAPTAPFIDCTGDLDINCSLSDYSYSPFSECNFGIIKFLDGVEVIGNNALHNVSCKSVHLNAGIKEIGNNALYLAECESINCEEFNQLTSIGTYAFRNANLNNLSLPKSLKTIGEFAFTECKINSDIVLYSGATIGYSAFYAANLKKITIQDGVSFEQKNSNCNQFQQCSGILITHCQLPSSENTSPFSYHKFSSITIGDNVERINSLEYMTGYEVTNDITIGKNVTYIGYGAFNCTNLKVAYCKPLTPPMLGGSLLIFPKNTTVYVPKESVNSYKNASGWKEYSSYIIGCDF